MKTRATILTLLIISLSALLYLLNKESIRPLQPTVMQQDSAAYVNDVIPMPATEEGRCYYSVGMGLFEQFKESCSELGVPEKQLQQVLYGIHAYSNVTDNNQRKNYYTGVSIGKDLQSYIIASNNEYLKDGQKLSARAFMAGLLQKAKGSVKIKDLGQSYLDKQKQ